MEDIYRRKRFTMLRDNLKQELDKLNDEQLEKIADFIALVEAQAKQAAPSTPFWQRASAAERAREFRAWVSQLPQNSLSLPDEAFNRDTIYAE